MRFEKDMSQRQVAQVLNVSRSTVQEYWGRYDGLGLSWAEGALLPDSVLEEKLFSSTLFATEKCEGPDCAYIHRELQRRGVTLQLLWEEYREMHSQGYGYSRFCELYRSWAHGLKIYMRQVHNGGEKVYVDYSGKKPHIVDPVTGEIQEKELLVMVWGASNYTYSEAQDSQAFRHFAMGHSRGFSYFGCVPKFTVPDNMKSAVTRACRYDPDVNRGYTELCEHYGFGVLPTRPVKPRDKAKVEVGVQIVQRWILARLRNRVFHTLEQLNAAIWELLEDLNRRPMKKLNRSRRELFEEQDRPNALTLPVTSYVYHEWENCGMGLDYHAQVQADNGHYYSFPYQLYAKGRRVDVRLSETVVELFYKSERVALHARSRVPYKATTDPAHMPERHRSMQEMTPARFMGWAERIGAYTGRLIKDLFLSKTHPELAIRPALGILSLSKAVGPERLENAARIACENRFFRVRQLKEILKKGLDRITEKKEDTGTVENKKNVRGPGYYQQSLFPDKPEDGGIAGHGVACDPGL
jgi:transposase